MTEKQKRFLLDVARKVIEMAVRGQAVNEFDSDDPLFQEKRGCFVTIHNEGRLRGCIGRFEATDLVIAKGQANYETLCNEKKQVYFLFRVKCRVMAETLGLRIGDFVLERS